MVYPVKLSSPTRVALEELETAIVGANERTAAALALRGHIRFLRMNCKQGVVDLGLGSGTARANILPIWFTDALPCLDTGTTVQRYLLKQPSTKFYGFNLDENETEQMIRRLVWITENVDGVLATRAAGELLDKLKIDWSVQRKALVLKVLRVARERRASGTAAGPTGAARGGTISPSHNECEQLTYVASALGNLADDVNVGLAVREYLAVSDASGLPSCPADSVMAQLVPAGADEPSKP
jgi:hypothetical protein